MCFGRRRQQCRHHYIIYIAKINNLQFAAAGEVQQQKNSVCKDNKRDLSKEREHTIEGNVGYKAV